MNDNLSNLKEFNNLDVAGYAALHPELFAYVKQAMAQPGKQFLLIGDTDHNSPELKTFLRGAPLAALFRNAAVPHVAIEIKREMIDAGISRRLLRKMRAVPRGEIHCTAQELDEGRQERLLPTWAPEKRGRQEKDADRLHAGRPAHDACRLETVARRRRRQ